MSHVFSMTADSFAGEVIFEYDDAGNLVKYDLTGATLSVQQQVFILQKQPFTIEKLQEWQRISPVKIQEVQVTFEKFWNKYDDKLNSSKKKTQAKWEKMSKVDQQKAFNYLSKYFLYLPPGTRKKYAETYLNAELWNN